MSRDRPPEPRDLGGDEPRSDYGELIRRAGPASDVPELDMDALIAGAESAWHGVVERRRRRRLGRLSVAALIPLVLFAGWWLSRFLEPAVGTWEGRRTAESGVFVVVESALHRGQVLETGLERWIVRLEAAHRLRLDSGTRLILEEADVLRLEQGAVYVDATDPALEIRTSEASIRHIGTRYEVRVAAEATFVRVRHGRVQISTASGEIEIGPGQGVEIRRDGVLQSFEAPTYGESWDWVLAARPPFDLTSPTLLAVLQWAAAETGYELVIEPALEPLLEEERLQGLPTSQEPRQLVAIAIESSKLKPAFRWIDGKLLVTSR